MFDKDLNIFPFVKGMRFDDLGGIGHASIFSDDWYRTMCQNLFERIAPGKKNAWLFTHIKDYNQLRAHFTADDARNGLFVLRSYLAHHFYHQHHKKLQTPESAEFAKHGFLTRENFLPPALHNEVQKFINSDAFPLAVHKGADSMAYNSATINSVVQLHIKPVIQRTFAINPDKISQLIDESTFVQKLHNRPDDGDVQKVMHSDTFFPALKFWYFPNDVSIYDGPFVMVDQSHIFDEKMATFIHRESIRIMENKVEDWRTYGHAEGSLRAGPEDIKNYPATLVFEVPANTLLVANVFGFHARGQVKREAFRNAIHGGVRTNTPFSY